MRQKMEERDTDETRKKEARKRASSRVHRRQICGVHLEIDAARHRLVGRRASSAPAENFRSQLGFNILLDKLPPHSCNERRGLGRGLLPSPGAPDEEPLGTSEGVDSKSQSWTARSSQTCSSFRSSLPLPPGASGSGRSHNSGRR